MSKTASYQASPWPIERTEPEAVGLCSKRLARVGDVTRRYVEEGRAAGIISLVARRGRIAYLNCVGRMNLGGREAMREDAIFRIYSMTKPITCVAALMLMEEGRYLLAEPVKKFLPEFADLRVAVPGPRGREKLVAPRRDVTIHDLMTHLGGLTYDCIYECREAGQSLAEFITAFCRRPLRHQPGEVWDYSASQDVLGRLIEVVAGQPFDEFLQQRIFAPLGMTDTAFYVPKSKAARLAGITTTDDRGRLIVDNSPFVNAYLKKPSLPSGGGGLVSTTSDYLRFALMLLGEGEALGVRLLSRKTVELMTDDHLPPGHAALDVNRRGYGLGVSVVRRVGETQMLCSVGEFGWGGAACTQTWIDPAEEMITMVMLQHRPKEKYPLMDLVRQTSVQAIID